MIAIEADITVIDFETTGVVGDLPSEPWQIGMVQMTGGRVDPARQFESLLRVGNRPFNPKAPGHHHKLRDEIAAAPTVGELWPELQNWWLGRPLGAHNVSVEKNIVCAAAPMHRPGPWIDTLKLARVAYPRTESHALGDLLERLGLMGRTRSLCPDREPHDALFDAVGCAVLLESLLSQDGWAGVTVEQLESVQPEAYQRMVAGRGGPRPT